MNKIMLVGNLTREIKVWQGDGRSAAFGTVAVNEKYKDKNTGENKESSEFIDLVFNGKNFEFASKYLGKGDLVAIEGKLSISSKKLADGSYDKSARVQVQRVKKLSRSNEDQKSLAPQTAKPTNQFNEDDIPF